MKKLIVATSLACIIFWLSANSFADDKAEMSKMGSAMEISQAAAKMKVEEMQGHKKVGTISGTAQTQDELETKLSMAASMMGAKYYVITSLSNNNHAFGTADIYE
ncbi:DUF1471 domain-containing protein [Serratia sp. L9]|uniref:DUF1471 domain-containing protein n=1 Tax=Serratia sp. L9 TaxID=3423946 RepID=UPI003D67C74B